MAHNDFGEIDGIGHTTQGRYGHNVMGHIIGHSMGAERRGIASGGLLSMFIQQPLSFAHPYYGR